MSEPLSVLIVEDSDNDALLVLRALQKAGFEPHHRLVQDGETMAAALEEQRFDVILSDYSMPQFTGLDALRIAQERELDLPFIIISGTVGEDVAVGAMKAGADDYLMKGQLMRLGEAIRREREAAASRLRRRQAEAKLQHLNRVLRAIRDINQLIVHVKDAGQLIQQACDLLVETRGYAGAWIAIDGGPNGAATVAQAGWGHRFEPLARQLEQGRWPACRQEAVGSERGLAVRRPQTDCPDCPLGKRYDRELAVLAALRHRGHCLGLLGVTFPRSLPIDDDEESLLLEVAGDIAFALHDIELERQRARYAQIVTTSSEAMALVDRSYRYLEANPSYHRLVGAGESLAGRPVAAVLGSEVFEGTVRPNLDRCFAGEEVRFESARRGQDGTERTIDAIYSPCRSDDGTVTAAAVCVRDITGQRHLQTQVAQADRLASMGTLAAGVAHEINNPLSYVLYNLESLSEDLPGTVDAIQTVHRRLQEEIGAERFAALAAPAGARLGPDELQDLVERFDDALVGARRIRDIARSLGTFSRVEKDQLTEVDLSRVLQVATDMAYNEIKYRARLVDDYAELPPVVASEGRLSQVFLNLLINAAHAIDEGRVSDNEIRVRTWRDGDWICAAVSDTGCGIAPEHRDRLFEPFFTTKKIGEGAGLGLAISKNIVDGYGGNIEVDSEPGAGATFTVRLPIDPANEVEAEPARPLSEPPVRGRILVVDDEPSVRAAMVRSLRAHDTVEASSGAEAQRILTGDSRFDLVLCDVMMADRSGMDLHEWLAETHPSLAERLVFVTGGAFTPRARAYLNEVDNPRIEKPFDPKTLRRVVAEALRHAGRAGGKEPRD